MQFSIPDSWLTPDFWLNCSQTHSAKSARWSSICYILSSILLLTLTSWMSLFLRIFNCRFCLCGNSIQFSLALSVLHCRNYDATVLHGFGLISSLWYSYQFSVNSSQLSTYNWSLLFLFESTPHFYTSAFSVALFFIRMHQSLVGHSP